MGKINPFSKNSGFYQKVSNYLHNLKKMIQPCIAQMCSINGIQHTSIKIKISDHSIPLFPAQQQPNGNLSDQVPLIQTMEMPPPLPPPPTAASPDETINQHDHLFPYVQYSIPILYTINLLYALQSGFKEFPTTFYNIIIPTTIPKGVKWS
jgi:hypothetical protein